MLDAALLDLIHLQHREAIAEARRLGTVRRLRREEKDRRELAGARPPYARPTLIAATPAPVRGLLPAPRPSSPR